MFKDLTFQQFCALDCGRNMVVTSGPGAGKTRILSHRFCFILLTDHSVSLPHILTLTFTEKAAEEMKGRIYEMLSRLDLDLQARGDVTLKKRIREAREQFHKNRISTIHSFCANLLREYPVESGMDPGFVVIQGARQRKLMEQAIEAGLSSYWQSNREELMPLLQTFGGPRNLQAGIRNAIEHPLMFHRVIDTKERLFNTQRWESLVFREYCRVIKENSLIPYLKGLRDIEDNGGQYKELLSHMEEWYRDAEKSGDNLAIPELFRRLRSLVKEKRPYGPSLSIREGLRKISYVDLIEDFYPDLFAISSPDRVFGKQLNVFLKVAGVCIEHYQKEKESIKVLDFADLEAQSHRFLTDLFEDKNPHGLERIQKRFRYIMVDEFQDTNRDQWDIISLLCSHKGRTGIRRLLPGRLFVVGDKKQAIYRFRGGDVTVFKSMTDKIKESNPEKPVQLFWQRKEMNELLTRLDEGYPEYLNRHADAFETLSNSEREDIMNGELYLPHNFRSDPYPITFFNRAFDQIFGNKGADRLEAYETAPRPIAMPGRYKRSFDNSGSVTFYLTRSSSRGKDQAETEAALVVDIIGAILGRHGGDRFEYRNYPDIRAKIENNQLAIGILFFAFSHLKTFESILREADLPFKVHRGKGFFRCQEVMEMIQLLNYLSDERESISLLSALRSPIFGMTDPEVFDIFYGSSVTIDRLLSSENYSIRRVGKQIQSWRLLSSRLTLAELIRSVIADRSLTAIYSVHPNGKQRLANMEKLIELARRFQAEGNGSLPEFVEYCLEMAEEDEEEGEATVITGRESPICLMTIHAAKGLEFPMVIIPNLDRRLPTRPKMGKPVRVYASDKAAHGDWNVKEGEIPVWQVEIPELGYEKKYSPLGYLLMRRKRLEDMAENRRVFYVGCTRTKNHLVLIGRMKKSLMEKNSSPLSSEDYRERATILELLDDIYGFNLNFPSEESEIFEGKRGSPSVIWKDQISIRFKGIRYRGKKLDRSDFGIYDQKMKELDLTEPIITPPYLQLSFRSIRIFMECPLKFCYSVILGLKMDRPRTSALITDMQSLDVNGFGGRDEREYGSKEALFVGNLIHGYLEKHRFGDQLDEEQFRAVWRRLNRPDPDSNGLDEEVLKNIEKKAFDYVRTTIKDKKLIKILKGVESYSEVPFLFTISQGCEFRGVIDRLFRETRKNHWCMIDWKSNDLRDQDPGHVAKENDYHLQLACYRWAVEHILNENLGDAYIYFTDTGYLLKSRAEVDPEEIIKDILSKIEDYGNDIEKWVNGFLKMKGDIGCYHACEYCEYREFLCKDI